MARILTIVPNVNIWQRDIQVTIYTVYMNESDAKPAVELLSFSM